jgi:hypothetical protein
MQPLRRTLEDHDLGHLRIVAELWEVDLPPGDSRVALASLVQAMLAPGALEETVESLPARAAEALKYVLEHGGRAPLADLTRLFGPFREVGPGRRDRERPWLDRSAALEGLYYRGLLARAFADTPTGPMEFGFIPSEVLERLPASPPPTQPRLGKPAVDPENVVAAGMSAFDDATTLLAALRRHPSPTADLPPSRQAELRPFLRQPPALELLTTLLIDIGVLRHPRLRPEPQAAREFLAARPAGALVILRRAWLASHSWNDLAHAPRIALDVARSSAAASRSWPNDPALSRSSALALFAGVPRGAWWDVDTFVADVHHEQPGFQRPGGDFDSWYLSDPTTGSSLRGFEHWGEVDGRLLRFLVNGPLAWLGVVDLGLQNGAVTAFRLTPRFDELVGRPAAETDVGISEAEAAAEIFAEGLIRTPVDLAAPQRYQIARFATWIDAGPEAYVYRLTPSAMAAAKAQGLTSEQVRAILERASGRELPGHLAKALTRWTRRGSEGHLESTVVLETSDARVLRELQSHRTTSRCLGAALGPTAVRVRPGQIEALLAAATELGILLEPPPSLSEDA